MTKKKYLKIQVLKTVTSTLLQQMGLEMPLRQKVNLEVNLVIKIVMEICHCLLLDKFYLPTLHYGSSPRDMPDTIYTIYLKCLSPFQSLSRLCDEHVTIILQHILMNVL